MVEIRYPKTPRYIKGGFDPNVWISSNFKKEEGIKRGLDKINHTDIVSKMRSEMWYPNRDITKKNIYLIEEYIESVRCIKYVNEIYDDKNVIVFFHGGGYYGGSTETISNTCKYIAEQTLSTVISVDYSLSPEYPYPIALNEGYDIIKNLESKYQNIYLGGDSAGGGLACSVLIKDLEEKSNIVKGLIMYYPVLLIDLKYNMREDFKWDIKEYNIDDNIKESSSLKSESSGLKYAMPFIRQLYVKGDDPADKYISQINIEDDILKHFPKTLIFTVEFDYLRLEAEYFYKRLQNVNVKSKCIRYAGEIHAFIDKTGYNDNILDSVKEIEVFLND
ncbi:alpha/beta hydrolase fold domain-containing protein [Pseudostreptobacillus hongkongensis]|uniref:alpha/beta hydrolase fold domain-containing protein n=1 Tax=Pseudostreptobacillus hongkongensis TaxID=1162717 RepID=UPI000830D77E|nr:alpha/beta hydrolase fold domain-containing protein [Pseudostreptobacillus hongkongensis]